MTKPNRMRRSDEKRQIFSIRKFKFGAASALLGLSLLAGGQALADEVTVAEAPAVQTQTVQAAPAAEATPAAVNEAAATPAPAQAEAAPVVTETAQATTPAPAAPAQAEQPAVAADQTQGKAVENQTSVDVKVEKASHRAITANAEIKTTVTGEVHKGDYIDYTFENLPLPNGYHKQELKTEDGKVVGQMSIVDRADDAASLQNNELPNDSKEKQSLSTDTVVSKATLRVTFNELAESLTNIKYSISYLNQDINVLSANKKYDLKSRVLVNDKEIKTLTTEIAATNISKINTWGGYSSELSTATIATDGKSIVPQSLQFALGVSKEKPLLAGSTLTFSLSEKSPITFDASKLKVGDVIKSTSYRSYTQGTEVNANGIILNLRQEFNATVTYVSDKSVQMTLNKSLTENNNYGVNFGNKFLIADYSKLNLDSKSLSGIDSESVFYDDKQTLITRSTTTGGTLSINATTINAEAKQIANLTVRFLDQDGKELAPSLHSMGIVGDKYKTEALDFGGYRLIETPANAAGELGVGETVVTYRYQQIVGSVIERNVTRDGKVLREKTLVENAPIGTAYDTSAQEEEITVDGVTYRLVKKGENSVGAVTEGQTVVTNVYEKKKKTTTSCYIEIEVSYIYCYVPKTIDYCYYYQPNYYHYYDHCYGYSYNHSYSYGYSRGYSRDYCSRYITRDYYSGYNCYGNSYSYSFC